VAVPGAFTPTCQEQHITSYLGNLDKLKAKGVDSVVFIASNDAFVMSAWGKANGIKDDSIVSEPLSSSLSHFSII
jgi:alkyl hydroperoxide reductase 1